MQSHGTDSLISAETIRPHIPKNSTIIVGLSGGPDSVCLLHLLAQLKTTLNLTIIAAHLDHGWRAESIQDALWCQKLCQNLNIPIVIATADSFTYQPKYNGSKEDIGRKLRRYFFKTLASQYQAQAIALAHHQDDQIETFFIRLLRGSSVTGLAGMKQHDGMYLRPLLSLSKLSILSYLAHHQLSFVIDASNESSSFLRNRIRHNLLPTLDLVDNRWSKTIPNSIQQLQQTNDFLDAHSHTVLESISTPTSPKTINIDKFLQLHQVIQHRILLNLMIEQQIPFTASSSLFAEIIRFLQASKHHQHTIYAKYQINKKHGQFYFVTL